MPRPRQGSCINVVEAEPICINVAQDIINTINRGFFKYINGKRQCRNYINELQDEGGHLTNRNIDKAEVFNAFFASVFNMDDRPEGSQCLELEDMAVRTVDFLLTLNLCRIYWLMCQFLRRERSRSYRPCLEIVSWTTTLTPTPGNRDGAADSIPAPETRDVVPEPNLARQPTSERTHPEWVGFLVKEIGQMMKDYLSPSGKKPSTCHKKGESNDAADVTSAQVPAELQGHTQPAAVAPVETRKSKMKTRHLDREDQRGGSSQPAGEPEVEIITESLSYENLCNLRKDIARRGREALTTWFLRVWDFMGKGVNLDGTEARNLGSLTQNSGVDQIFVREPGPLCLWVQLLMSARERFVNRERMQEHHNRIHWKTLEEGIQHLREVAVLEVLFGRDGQHDNDPDKIYQ
ncbi:hypothetical protein TURU_109620 [Turdus rufiventris]|nr:hypothetical protein TURU_109620 [Turdus rufiventris]